MKNLKKAVLTAVAGLVTATSFGQFTLSGEIRPRAEFRNGYKKVMDSTQKSAFFIDQRTRLNLDFKVSDYEFFVSIQDVRVWGSTAQLNAGDGFLAIHEAWGKANFNEAWGLKLGRQEILYDDHRIFGNVDWAQQARSHDAALVQYAKGKVKLDIGLAFNQASATLTGTDYNGPNLEYRDMYFSHFNGNFGKVNLSLLALMSGRQVSHTNGTDNWTTMNYVSTLGTHTKFDFGKFKMSFNGYYELGTDNRSYSNPTTGKTTAVKYSGYLLGLDANYKLSESFSIGLGYETQSGNNPSDTTSAYGEKNRAFNPWFGTNHKFNGFMDYFYVGSGHGAVGLQDAFLKLEFKKKIWTVGLDAHMFMAGFGVEMLDNDSYISEFNTLMTAGDPVGAANLNQYDFMYGSYLGAELDLSIGTKINESVSVKAGYSHMFASDALYSLKGVSRYNIDGAGNSSVRSLPMNNWAYCMVIFKPTFLKKDLKKKEETE